MGRPKNFEPDVVIAQAMEAFWTNGYAGTSPADLAEATGVAKGSLYHAFGSKRELFGKALELYDRAGSEMTEELLARPGATKECIRDYLIFLVDTDLNGPVRRGCLGANTALELGGRDEEATRAVQRMGQHTIQLLTARIEQGRRDGDVAPEVDAGAQAQFLLNTIVGLRVMAKSFDGPILHGIIDTALAAL
ncbi:TetR/AcrR family transcriptional regulator [Streptomyces sp. NBC_00503]|uniref:TetR/AcrR family transcriptional regulator n=1 Tax=Streptomyces sp. NBC_00503 TaxID=2903659 RepID=UPI002E814377|nr:TetR/AcrR family transcriptional regulator [Streptomyces sp. NBC_00503]WUD85348.1 TetR/AcrR family transcriptional regulator [Streptomyces sp. NBC_00503]